MSQIKVEKLLLLICFYLVSCANTYDAEQSAKRYCNCMRKNHAVEEFHSATDACTKELIAANRYYRLWQVDMRTRELDQQISEDTRDSVKSFMLRFMDFTAEYCCKEALACPDSSDVVVNVDSIQIYDTTVLAYKINTLEITTKSGAKLGFRDSVDRNSQLPATYIVDSLSGDLYFNEFSYSINRMSTESGSILTTLKMPALNLLNKRYFNVPKFSIYKNYLFFSTNSDILIMSKDLDFSVVLGDEVQKDNGEMYLYAPIYQMFFDIFDDTLRIKTTLVYDVLETDQDVRVVNHAIYLPADPHHMDLRSYRIRGKSRENIPFIAPTRE